MKVAPGTVIAGRFELRSHAADGGMGAVFLARDHVTKRDVALKVLARDGADDVIRFEREASLLATVRHPNVVKYIAHGESAGVYFIAQEWVEGFTLAMQLRASGVTAREAVALATGVADALGAAHAVGVVHRDVKPSNIILDANDLAQPRLVDFGVARMTEAAGVLTRTGVLIGTPAYMSPEQCRGQTFIDAAADVWALGCVLFEALTGRNPFFGASATAIRAKVLLGTPPPLEQLCAEVNDDLIALLGVLLAKHPGERPANGTAAAAQLRALKPVHDGPRRKTGHAAGPQGQLAVATTARTPMADAQNVNAYVFVTPHGTDPVPDEGKKLAAIAGNLGLHVDVLEDGTALLTSHAPGKAGALAAARAAMQIRDEVWEDAAVTVFGRAYQDDVTDAIDRGAALLEQSNMESVFGDVVDDVSSVIRIDDVIAELIADEVQIDRGANGATIIGLVPPRTR
ncbi:MAG TPA: serine/threonine-protein kinase [Kofleriaceae bacterium]|jgi:hypothetical protein